MYIKKVRKRNPGGQRQYEYLHLVENVRTEQGPRQRLVLNLGTLPIEADQYKELANTIEGMLTGQAELFSSDPRIEKQARKAVRRLVERRAHRRGEGQPENAAGARVSDRRCALAGGHRASFDRARVRGSLSLAGRGV